MRRVCAALACLLFAAGMTGAEDLSDSAEKLKADGTQLLFDMKDALDKAGEALTEHIRPLTSRACIGTWEFKNGSCVTTIECLENGTMSLSQQNGRTASYWRGTYTSSASEIMFFVSSWEETRRFSRKSAAKNETWTLSYRVPAGGPVEMRVSSPDIPPDGNGYDFSTATLFTAVK